MKKLFKFFTAGALALSAMSVSASNITVGGVTWDPDASVDFQTSFRFYQNFNGDPNTAGTELSGLGEIFSVNDLFNNEFCPSGCQLAFVFSEFLTDGNGGFEQGSGKLSVYVDSDSDYDFVNDPQNSGNITDGTLWLELIATSVVFETNGGAQSYNSGSLFVDWDLGTDTALAYDFFVPGSQPNGSDAFSDTSASFLVSANSFKGTGSLYADTDAVSAPSTIAVFGLSLLGFGTLKRRRKV